MITILLFVICIFISLYALGITNIAKLYFHRTHEEINKVKKMIRINESLSKLLELLQDEKKVSDYLTKNHYQSVAIYGMGDLGQKLFNELAKEGVIATYTIDRNLVCESKYNMIPLSDKLPDVDIIIVTAVSNFDDIYLDLQKRVNGEIVNIEDVLWSL
ncbi:MAG: hypothetical protein K5662_07620 [Lachnospiraceae bacterium]|nr:hypothetical protein [Lachnospiraceae bacterium]